MNHMITASDNVLENLLTVELLNMQSNIKDAIKDKFLCPQRFAQDIEHIVKTSKITGFEKSNIANFLERTLLKSRVDSSVVRAVTGFRSSLSQCSLGQIRKT